MKLSLRSPIKALSKAYLKQSVRRKQIGYFDLRNIVGANGVRPDSGGTSTAGFDSAQPANRPLSVVPERSRGEVEGDIPALETETDRLVYALYRLSEEENAVVEGRA